MIKCILCQKEMTQSFYNDETIYSCLNHEEKVDYYTVNDKIIYYSFSIFLNNIKIFSHFYPGENKLLFKTKDSNIVHKLHNIDVLNIENLIKEYLLF